MGGKENGRGRRDEELLQTRLSPGLLYQKLETDGYLNLGQGEERREAPEEKEQERASEVFVKTCMFLTSEGQERPKREKSGDIS